MVKPESIEQLIYFMKSKISLGRYDQRFINNLVSLKQVTTNQVELFYKIVLKHSKQFLKFDMYVDQLVNLPWGVKVIESAKQYTEAYILIENNQIIFKSPYNRNFINDLRNIDFNNFVWIKDEKQYQCDYGQYELKNLVNLVKKHFEIINLCPITKKILDELEIFNDVKHWEPTLVSINDYFFIAATNEYVNEAIKNIKLSNDLTTLAELVRYGIKIDKSLYDSSKLKDNFFVNYISTVEYDDLEKIILYIKELGCKHVAIHGSSMIDSKRKQVSTLLNKNDIKFFDLNIELIPLDLNQPLVYLKLKSFSNTIYNKNTIKIIQLVNSNPIEIK